MLDNSSLDDEPWSLSLPKESALLDRLAADNPSLAEVSDNSIFQGVVTGADGIFRALDVGDDPADPNCRLVRPEGLDAGMPPISMEKEWLRPIFAGRTSLRRFHARASNEWLILPYERTPGQGAYQLAAPRALARRAPNVYRWLEEHRDGLKDRQSGTWTDQNWYAYSRRQNLEKFEGAKVMVPYMVSELCAHYDVEGHYFVNVSTGGYGIEVTTQVDLDPVYLTALLNSQLLSWALCRYSRAFRGNWFGARKGNLKRLPVAVVDRSMQAEVVELYRHCQRLASEIDEQGTPDEPLARLSDGAIREFDRAVFALYGLTEEEVVLVRSGAPQSIEPEPAG